ncbi:thiamine pyrophosphate-binding protein [Limimaricola pyoseonensis]|uniref:Acetolactate synthase-1/2/3 large subunit n=1 Tax=Limimaricola pyoseonensis TaxID=521013 RepID=A0A1G6ZXN1_9RHOB|nr:thiamine pyrophosphate-binding protein [Limimaricola pyoseonensis]SDE07280.1 acetolactate synthase-1/2/3 large subunit [Limimaricola pyoseonensis]
MMRGADLLVRSLAAAGVTRIFALSGNQIMPVFDACLSEGIKIVHVRHEAAAAYMAEAHAQITGEIGVALVTAGAGFANAIGPLFTARASETPLLLLSGDSPVAQDGRGAFQEMRQSPIAAPLVKLTLRPGEPAQLGEATARAIRTALSGRPGPVHMALPFDVLTEDAAPGRVPQAGAFHRQPAAPSDDVLREIGTRLSAAARPVILCGPSLNATRTGELCDALSAARDAPVIVMESPRGLNDPSLGAVKSVMAEADLVLLLGKCVDFTTAFGAETAFSADARFIQVDAGVEERDRAHLNLRDRLDASHAADPRDTARALAQYPGGGSDRRHWNNRVADRLATRAAPSNGARGITPAEICAAVQRRIDAAGDAVLVADGGEFGQWAQACVRARRRIINGPSGAIGAAPCYALAARAARPGATVFALMGDGTAGFHLADFETAARHGHPFIAVIGNDRRWNAEHQIQLREYGAGRLIGCELSGARYDLAVAALGGYGEHVTSLEELDGALERAERSGLVACINVEMEGLPAPTL